MCVNFATCARTRPSCLLYVNLGVFVYVLPAETIIAHLDYALFQGKVQSADIDAHTHVAAIGGQILKSDFRQIDQT